MMAAGCAAQAVGSDGDDENHERKKRSASRKRGAGGVVLLEGNSRPGMKLLITGNGRCNLTNSQTGEQTRSQTNGQNNSRTNIQTKNQIYKRNDLRHFIDAFGRKGKFLYSAMKSFGIDETLDFFNDRGLETKIESGGRVLPVSDRAFDVLCVMEKFMKESGVRVERNTRVTGFTTPGGRISGVRFTTKDDRQNEVGHQQSLSRELTADSIILCTGGLSYPSTGSTGEGLQWVEKLGHTIVPPRPALAPVLICDPWIGELCGISLVDASVGVFLNDKMKFRERGEMLFTHDGVSGPVILKMSSRIGELLETVKDVKGKKNESDIQIENSEEPKHADLTISDTVQLRIDFFPNEDSAALDSRFQSVFCNHGARCVRNCLHSFLPRRAVPVIFSQSKIHPEKKFSVVTRDERKRLVGLMKGFPLTVHSIGGFERAMLTAGGVALKEIDPKTMRSKIVENLYFAGELVDLDGPTGGYNLQMCWSTGRLAGLSAAGIYKR